MSTQSNAAPTNGSLDAFVLFNRLENDEPYQIILELESRGIKTFFERRDVDISQSESERTQDDARDRARSMLVLMGPKGWGPLQLEYTNLAVRESKPIVICLMKGATREMVATRLPNASNFLTVDLNRPNGMEALIVALGGTGAPPPPESSVVETPVEAPPEVVADDAFLLGDGSQNNLLNIMRELGLRGLSVFFYDPPPDGADSPSNEIHRRFEQAKTIIVLVGKAGWRPVQQNYIYEALDKFKPIILVKLNEVSNELIAQASPELLRVPCITISDPKSIHQLWTAILREQIPVTQAENLPVIDQIANGKEDERSQALEVIRNSSSVRKAWIAQQIVNKIKSIPPPVSATTKNESSRSLAWLISALAEANIESPASREILTRLAGDARDDVRYWTLAGAHKKNATYKVELAEKCLGHPALEIHFLAQAILNELDIDSLRRNLSSSDPFDAKSVFRVLRVFAIPELATDVCEAIARLGQDIDPSWVYDALYAISLPEMAKAAAEYWGEKNRIRFIVRHIVAMGAPNRQKMLRRFSKILAPLPQNEVRERLQRLRPDNVEVVDFLLSTIAPESHLPNIKYIPNVGSDTLGLFDRLGIETDVETLSAVIAAKNVHAPLAIGLFGAWGSGKSFFMKLLKKSIKRRAEEAKSDSESPYFSRIETIDFNAWHYYDTNLWASLINNIFEQLDACVSPRVTKKEEIEQKKSQIDEAKQQVQKATGEQANLATQLAEAEKNLSVEKEKREVTVRSIEDLGLPDLRVLVLKNPELVGLAEKYLKASGALDVMSSLAGLRSTLDDALSTGKKIKAFFKTIWDDKRGRRLLAVWIIIALFGGSVTLLVVQKFVLPIIGGFSVASIAAYFVSVNSVLKDKLKKVKDHFAQLENASNEIKALLTAEQNKPTKDELNLESSVVAIRKQLQDAESRVEKSKQVVSALESEVDAIVKANSLRSFLANRRDADDYIKHLGLMSTIRKDLKELEKRVSNVDDDGTHIERIVLFIDDLDRCPTEKVLEVLQAVHLLLAFELFVVVVGVDPKWLMHSLSENYTQFQAKTNKPTEATGEDSQDSDNGEWHTRPRDFLEKIFQIPFRLNAMSPDGFGDLVSDLFSDDKSNGVTDDEIVRRTQEEIDKQAQSSTQLEPKQVEVTATSNQDIHMGTPVERVLVESGPAASDSNDGPIVDPTVDSQQDSGPDTNSDTNIPDPTEAEQQEKEQTTVKILDAALLIKPHEIEFAKQLSPLITNPRAVKRFTNVYRILKAPLTREEIEVFEGTKENLGQFQAVMLILAILVGSSDFAASILPQLKDALDKRKPIVSFFTEYFDNPEAVGIEFKDLILPIIKSRRFPRNAALLKLWLPKVCRFSFETGQLIN